MVGSLILVVALLITNGLLIGGIKNTVLKSQRISKSTLGVVVLSLLFVGVTNDFGLEFFIASSCLTVVLISMIKLSSVLNY
jgi:hypothetical protein